jgi:anti-sigma factor RsiW
MAEMMQHEDAITLLPWLANGTLDGPEHEAVRAHAAACVLCRRELDALDSVRRSIAAAGDAIKLPEPDMRRINARIDAELSRKSPARTLAAALQAWAANRWRVAFALQTALLLVLAVVLLRPTGVDDAPYTTLTAPASLAEGHYLRVIFIPELDGDALDALLAAHDLAVADGPSVRGVHTLRFPDGSEDAQRSAALAALEDDARVLFVQPVAGGAGP